MLNTMTLKYKNIFTKRYSQNWSEVFVVSIIKDTSQEKFRIEKVIKIKCDKLYVKDIITHLIVGSIKKILNEILSYRNESIIS